MFAFFKSRKKNFPPFETLAKSQIKEKYFVRTMQWGWLNETMIHVLDHKNQSPRMITMDPWPQQVYLDADGSKTIEEYVYWMAK